MKIKRLNVSQIGKQGIICYLNSLCKGKFCSNYFHTNVRKIKYSYHVFDIPFKYNVQQIRIEVNISHSYNKNLDY
jgi:hypothetical protein